MIIDNWLKKNFLPCKTREREVNRLILVAGEKYSIVERRSHLLAPSPLFFLSPRHARPYLTLIPQQPRRLIPYHPLIPRVSNPPKILTNGASSKGGYHCRSNQSSRQSYHAHARIDAFTRAILLSFLSLFLSCSLLFFFISPLGSSHPSLSTGIVSL